jgi:hypothetical protein
MSEVIAGPNDIRIHLSGGTNNANTNLSIGGPISSFYITSKTFNNLWSNVSERQRRYGFKDLRIIYLKNAHPSLTFKNARVYWNKTDNFTSLQIGRAPVSSTENSTPTTSALLASAADSGGGAIPPTMWSFVAADTFRIVQDFNSTSRNVGHWIMGSNGGNTSRRGVRIADSSSPITNQKIARMTFLLKCGGTPRGSANCKIWDSSGSEMASLGSVNASTLNKSGQTPIQPFTTVQFTNQGNTYECQVGDVIGLEYPGGGQDEGSGDPEDTLNIGAWEWTGQSSSDDPSNSQYDISGTEEVGWITTNEWILSENGQCELIYRAETFGPEGGGGGGGGGEPCNPDTGPGDPGDPGNPSPPPSPTSGFLIITDFNNITATTGYQVGSGAPNNIFRRAVSIDNTTAAILSAPIARITFLMRRVGNPLGDVTCRIWDINGTVKATISQFGITGITNMAPQWTQVPFTLQNNAYQMKVGDLIGVEYTAGNPQDHIVVAGWTFQGASAQSATAEVEGGQIAAATDKFGTRMIYANSGSFLYDWEIPSNSDSMRWDLTNPPINMEMTGYFMKSSPSSDTVSCKVRGGKHTDSAQNDGCCYIPQFPCTGGSMEFEIECPHPDNHDCAISGTHGTALSLAQWHGYKVVVWNTSNNCVHLEAWQDKGNNSGSTPINQWEKVFVHDDCDGNCGNIDNPLLKPKGSTSQCTFRIDNNSGTSGKWLSAVAITPGEVTPGPGPSPPPPSPGPPPSPPPSPGPGPPPPAPGPAPPAAKDVPGTSIKRWNGTTWSSDDGGNSDLVYKTEKFVAAVPGPGEPPEAPAEDPIIMDPGTKRKPTSFDQGIVIPPLGPGQYKALILERLFPPKGDAILEEDVEQQLVIEVDTTTEPSQPVDPGNPPPVQPPPPSPPPPGPGPSPPPSPPPPSPGPAPGQVGPYPGTGKQLSSTTRRATRHYASGKPDDETIEKNTDNISYQHYQCVYYVTMHKIEHDDTVSTKLGGTHMGSGWFDHGVSFQNGKTCLGTEPNHPDTNSCIKTGPSIGSIIEKRVGIAAIFRRPNVHTELWTKLPGGNWVKALENTGPLGGFDPNNDGDHEAQLRIDGFEDGSDPTIDTAIVQEIGPS